MNSLPESLSISNDSLLTVDEAMLIESKRADASREDLLKIFVQHIEEEQPYHDRVAAMEQKLNELSTHLTNHCIAAEPVLLASQRINTVMEILCIIRKITAPLVVFFGAVYLIFSGKADWIAAFLHKVLIGQ